MKTYTQRDQRSLMEAITGAFLRLRAGSNSIGDFNTLAGAVNIGLVRSEKLDRAVEEIFQAGQRALLRADQHFNGLRAYYFTEADWIDIAKAVTGYAELLRLSTEEQMQAAITEADRRLAANMHARLPGGSH
jgi:hypothetical protein